MIIIYHSGGGYSYMNLHVSVGQQYMGWLQINSEQKKKFYSSDPSSEARYKNIYMTVLVKCLVFQNYYR